MSFISAEFVLFAVLIFSAYFLIAQRWRWLFLLLASYYFYAFWQPSYLLLIIFSTLVDYLVGLALGNTCATKVYRRRLLLACSLVANLGLLFIFKYANLLGQAVTDLSTALGISVEFGALDLLLPVGISFYTFQSMAYTFDVYRGRNPAQRHFGIFATYVAFFPQLVAGPIERATNMLPQFQLTFGFDYDRVVSGLRLILWGVFKKVVIADRLAIYVNAVYGDVESYTGLRLIVATVFFAFQIYCDFSAYSDIAIGTARILGFRLMENFRRPYLAISLRDFWRRWHISLSTWFRDYVYIGLGGNRQGASRQVINLLIVFALSGLWHGANWTFLLWGLFHGVIVALETVFKSRKMTLLPDNIIGQAFSILFTFMLVNFGWILFRAQNLAEIQHIYANLLDFSQGFAGLTEPFQQGLLPWRMEFALAIGLIALLVIIDVADERLGMPALFTRLPLFLRWLVYYVLLICIYVSLYYNTTIQEFFYFQF